MMGCGFEPIDLRPTGEGGSRSWFQAPFDSGASEFRICPGYTTALPGIIQVARLVPHWRTQQLAEYVGESPPQPVYDACAELDAAINVWKSWRITHKDGE